MYKKPMRRSALACLLQASGFYHGETLPVLSKKYGGVKVASLADLCECVSYW